MRRGASGVPIVVSRDLESSETLERADLREEGLLEDWLQRVVFEHPEVLPVEELDSSFGPLVPIGREIPTRVGSIDALYVSPSATLTVVETKLWRNPEARRQVVAQIIDYASDLSRWSYEHLDRVARERSPAKQALWQLIQASGTLDGSTSETDFIDGITRTLQLGRFLLLIVGDGIREEVERMVEYVQTRPRLQFTLGLVELRVFRRPTRESCVVVPNLVVRTAEVTRAVVEVSVAPEANVNVEVTVPSPGEPGVRLDEAQFFDELSQTCSPEDVDFVRAIYRDFAGNYGFIVVWRKKNMMIKSRHLLAEAPHLTLLAVGVDGRVSIGWLCQQLAANGIDAKRGAEYAEETAKITGNQVHERLLDAWRQAIPISRIRSVWPELYAYIREFTGGLGEVSDRPGSHE